VQLRRDRSIRVYDQLTAWTIHHSARLSGACWLRAFSVTNGGFTFEFDMFTYGRTVIVATEALVLGAALASNSYYGLLLRCKAVMRQNTIRVTSKKVNYAVCFMRNLS
jgi:hypothetical protein